MQFLIFALLIGIQLLLRAILPGPKPLDSMQISHSAEGEPIPFSRGQIRVAGGLTYASDIRGVQVKSKGGKVWHYFQTVFYEILGNPAQGIYRIWADSDVIYDNRPGFPLAIKYTDIGMTFYLGTEDQQPDTDIEAIVGVGGIEAFRGCTGIKMKDLPLHQFSYRLPNFTFETYGGNVNVANLVERFPVYTMDQSSFAHANGWLWCPDDANQLIYMVNAASPHGTGWQLSKIDSTTGNVILSVPLASYPTDAQIRAGAFACFSSGWQNMMSISGDSSTLWVLVPLQTSGHGTEYYEYWVFRTSDLTQLYTFTLPSDFNAIPAMGGTLAVSKDGTYIVKVGDLNAGGWGGWDSPPKILVQKMNGSGGIQWYDTPLDPFLSAIFVDQIRAAVFDENDNLFLTVEEVTSVRTYYIRKYTINPIDCSLILVNQLYLFDNFSGSTGQNAPIAARNNSSNSDYEFAYNVGLGQLVLGVMPSTYVSGSSAAPSPGRFLFIDPTSNSIVTGVDNLYGVNWSFGDRRFRGLWLANNLYFTAANFGSFGDAANETFVSIDTTTGTVAPYSWAIWENVTTWPGLNVTYLPYYNVTENSIMVMEPDSNVDDGTGNPAGSLDILNFPSSTSLQDVVEDCFKAIGLLPADYDCSAGASVNVRGVICKDRQALREFLSSIQPAYFFDIIESDWKLKLVLRDNLAPLVTIPDDDVLDDGSTPPFFEYTDTDPMSVPPWVDITYMDFDKDYQPGSQPSRLPDTSFLSVNSGSSVQLPCVLTSDEAATIGAKILDAAWAERDGIGAKFTQKYLQLEPTDPINLARGTDVQQVKITEGNVSSNFQMDMKTSTYDGLVYSQIRKGTSRSWYTPATVILNSTPVFLPLDTSLLRAQDDSAGLYSAVGASTPNGRVGPCEITRNGIDTGIVSAGAPTWGTFNGSLSTWNPLTRPWEVFDNDNVLIVDLTFGTFFSQSTSDIIRNNGLNLILVGDELIQFCSASQVSANRWQLTQLLRGRMGTETLINTQFDGDNVVLIEQANMENITYDNAQIGTDSEYQALDTANALNSGFVDITDLCRRFYCRAPFRFKASRDMSNNLTVAFLRRSRVAGKPFWTPPYAGGELPVFEVDIMSGSTVLRTITSTASGGGSVIDPILLTVYYSAADQTTDGGTPGNPVDLRIYQLHNVHGRGYPGEDTV